MDSLKLSTRLLILLFFVSCLSIKIVHGGTGLLFGSTRVEAFGRDVKLGNFYDSRNDKLGSTEVTFLEGPIPSWAITTEETPTRSSHTAVIKKPIDIFKNFEVDKEVKINYLLGIMDIAPRGKYLKLNKEIIGAAVVMGDVVFKYGTVSQSLNIFDSELDETKQSSIVVKSKAPWGFTHIVTEIQYGAIVSVCFKYNGHVELSSLQGGSISTQDVENHLKRQMEYLRDTNRTEIFKKYFKENPNAPKFHFEITGDIPTSENIPIISVFDVISFLDKVPNEIKKLNGGKGHPVSFEVQPIDNVKAVLTMNSIGSSNTSEPLGNPSEFDLDTFLGSDFFQTDNHSHPSSKTKTTTEEPKTESPFHFSIPSPTKPTLRPTTKAPTKATTKAPAITTTTVRTTTRKTTTTTAEPETKSPFHFSIPPPSKTTPKPKALHLTTTKATTTTQKTTTTPLTTTTLKTTTTPLTTTTPRTTTTPETTTLESTTEEATTSEAPTPETTTTELISTTITEAEIIPISEIQQSEARLLGYSSDSSRFRIDFRFLLVSAFLCQLLLVY